MTNTPWDPDSPTLREAIVCYADILGFRALTDHAFELDQGAEFLRTIKNSISVAYGKVHRTRTLAGLARPLFDLKVFTDNIVVAYPIDDLETELGESELGTILMLFAEVQASLASNGFLLRGAITVGPHYQDQDIAYGPALFEAVDLDKSGGSPRLVIAPSAERLIAHQLTSYDHVTSAPHYWELLEDSADSQLFIDYLGIAFENFQESGIDRELLGAFRGTVSNGLQKHRLNPRVWQKYKWLATYHNYVCSEFADSWYAVRNAPDADLEALSFSDEAQGALDFLVDINALPPPRRFDAERFQGRLDS